MNHWSLYTVCRRGFVTHLEEELLSTDSQSLLACSLEVLRAGTSIYAPVIEVVNSPLPGQHLP